MNHDFYLDENGEAVGPIDTLAIMKKVRNGKITADTLIYVGKAEQSVPAASVPEIAPFFESENEQQSEQQGKGDFTAAPTTTAKLDLFALLKEAWSFFGETLQLTFFGGATLVASIMVSVVLSTILPDVISSFLGMIAATFFYFLFLMVTLRATRMQDISPDFVRETIQQHWKSLLFSSAFAGGITLGVPMLLGSLIGSFFYLLIIPGLLFFSLFIFTPFFLFEEPDLPYKEALKRSKQWIVAQGMDNLGTIAMLVILNALCGMAFLPIFITLPLTSIALANIYETRISNSM